MISHPIIIIVPQGIENIGADDIVVFAEDTNQECRETAAEWLKQQDDIKELCDESMSDEDVIEIATSQKWNGDTEEFDDPFYSVSVQDVSFSR